MKSNKKLEYLGLGKRKTSIARVRLLPNGNGKITINDKPISEYFPNETLVQDVKQGLVITKTEPTVDVVAKVKGGGLSGQAGALRHGIVRALLISSSDYRPILKKAGLITRDSRIKERKKYGLKSARRAPQFSKR